MNTEKSDSERIIICDSGLETCKELTDEFVKDNRIVSKGMIGIGSISVFSRICLGMNDSDAIVF